jgi:hypothetical protein
MTLSEAKNKFPPIYTIYRTPRDFPRHWVVRVWWGMVPEPVGCLCSTIGEARDCVPWGAVRLPKDPQDDPVIFEHWI